MIHPYLEKEKKKRKKAARKKDSLSKQNSCKYCHNGFLHFRTTPLLITLVRSETLNIIYRYAI